MSPAGKSTFRSIPPIMPGPCPPSDCSRIGWRQPVWSYKYAASKGLYEAFEGEVKGKFATIYCTTPDEIPPILHLTNQLFTQEGITPVARSRIDELDGLRHELPLIGGYGFVRYGAFCYTNGLLDLTDPSREPIRDNRHLPFPRFRDPARLGRRNRSFQRFKFYRFVRKQR